jgi:hypothetical protein
MAYFELALSDIHVFHGISTEFEFPRIIDPEGLTATLRLNTGPSFIIFDSNPSYHIQINPTDSGSIGSHNVQVEIND